jgi:hypothetical protein
VIRAIKPGVDAAGDAKTQAVEEARAQARGLRAQLKAQAKALRAVRDQADRRLPRRSRGPGFVPLLVGGAVGGLLAYFLDPERGRSRRAQAQDRIYGMLRRSAGRMGSMGRGMNAQTVGLKQRVIHLSSGRPAGDDVTIADRVESEVFRETGLPKGAISVDVRNGVVVLRGELARQDQIEAIERATRGIHGVSGVENLLHLPGTPAPNKAEARRESTA